MSVLHRYFTAFTQRDWATMGACYAEDANFHDPVFLELDALETRAMWRMLLSGGTDLQVRFRVEEESTTAGVCAWEASYTFSRTGRKVHNVVRSAFRLRDGLIVHQQDRFNLWRWSAQALGPSGLLLGWTPWMRGRVRAGARAGLRRSMARG